MARIGIDIGGTFTDLCVVGDDGQSWSTKLLTTPSDPSVGFLGILDRAFDADPAYADAREIVHATTVATNAVLERDTARMGLITTAGFRDVLEIGRHFRRELYDFFVQKPPVLVPRERRLEVEERIDAQGAVLTPLNRAQARAALEALLAQEVEVILVCFLHSYAYPQHELAVAELASGCTDVPVITSHSVCREYREYERFSTAAVHGAVAPKVREYMSRIEEALQARGIGAPLSVMQSSGGMARAATVAREPAVIVESGPAAGVISAVAVGRRLGIGDLISFDMGGTSAKATLIRDGRIAINTDYEIGGGIQGGFGTGYPIRTPVVDLVEIGTGGGSIARVNEAGHLQVGPQSAGAEPGPACYGLGGATATITDADVVLGRLRAEDFAGGRLTLDVEAARRAIAETVAGPLGMPLQAAAEGIVALGNAQMVRALELVSVERGFDPREFVMVAFGGAGPAHAAELAAELGCRRVIIPPEAGVQSALGLLVADARRDFSHAVLSRADEVDLARIRSLYEQLEAHGRRELLDAGFASESLESRLSVDARYLGQAYELTVELPVRPTFTPELAARISKGFHEAHQRRHGHSDSDAAVEWVTLRVSVSGAVPQPAPHALPEPTTPLSQRRRAFIDMTWAGETVSAPVYARADLGPGDRLLGPALIVQDDSTIAVPPEVGVMLESTGDLALELEASE